MNNKAFLKYKNKYLVDSIRETWYRTKMLIPNNNMIFSIIIFFKFLGALIITNSYSEGDNDNKISGFLSRLTYSNLTFSFSKNIISLDILFNLLVYLLLIADICCCKIIKKFFIEGKDNIVKFTVKIDSFLKLLIVIFSHYFVEIQFNIFIQLIIKFKPGNFNITYVYENDNMLVIYICCIFNFVGIIYMNILMYEWNRVINNPFADSQNSISLKLTATSNVFLLILQNFQSFFTFEKILNGKASLNFKLIALISALVIAFGLIRSLGWCSKNIVDSTGNWSIFFNLGLICISAIFELLLYYINLNSDDGRQVVLKMFLYPLITYVAIKLLFKLNKRSIKQEIQNKIFSIDESLTLYCLTYLVEKYKYCMSNPNSYSIFFKIIGKHSIQCKNTLCECKSFSNKGLIKSDYLSHSIENYNIIGNLVEQEIRKLLLIVSKNENKDRYYSTLIFYVSYILYFKKNNLMAAYVLDHNFRGNSSKFFDYYVFELRMQINKMLKEKTNSSTTSFINQIILCEELKSKMLTICQNSEDILNTVNTNISLLDKESNKNVFIDSLLNKCTVFKSEDKQLKEFLSKHMKMEYLIDLELNYLLTQFFNVFEIYNILDYKIINIENYPSKLEEKVYNDYLTNNPMIINYKRNESFIIQYVYFKLYNILGYSKKDLIGKDFHLLLPDKIAISHFEIMKRSIFIEGNYSLKQNKFILNQEGQYIPFLMKANSIVSLDQKINFFVDFDFEAFNSRKALNIITNGRGKIKNFSSDFVERYFLDSLVTDTFKLNIFNLFSISKKELWKEFEDIQSIIKSNPLDDFNILNCNLYKIHSKDNVCLKSLHITVTKESISNNIKVILNSINEIEYDVFVVERLKLFLKVLNSSIEACKEESKYLPVHDTISKQKKPEFDIIINFKFLGNACYTILDIFDLDPRNYSAEEKSLEILKSSVYKPIKFDSLPRLESTPNLFNNMKSTDHLISITNERLVNQTNEPLVNSYISNKNLNLILKSTTEKSKKLNKKDKKMDNNKHIFKNRLLRRTIVSKTFLSLILITLFLNFFIKNSFYLKSSNTMSLYLNLRKLSSSNKYAAAHQIKICKIMSEISLNGNQTIEDYKLELNKTNSEQVDSIYYIKQVLGSSTYNEWSPIFKSLYTYFDISNLFENWGTYNTSDTTINQYIIILLGSITTLQNHLNGCNITYFLNNNFTKEKPSLSANISQRSFYSQLENILLGISSSAKDTINLTFNILNKINQNMSDYILIFNCIVLLFLITSVSIYITVFSNRSKVIKNCFLKFVEDKGQDLMKRNIKNLKTVLTEFKLENVLEYEDKKNKLHVFDGKLKKSKLKLITQKIKLKKSDSFDEESKLTMDKIKVKYIIFAKYVLIISGSICCLILLYNLAIINHQIKDFSLMLEMGSTYLERFNNIITLLLYYEISIIHNNVNYIELPFNQYRTEGFNYYNISIDTNADSFYSELGFSYILQPYYNLAVINQNIEKFENSNSNLLKLTKNFFNSIQNDKLCIELYLYLNAYNLNNQVYSDVLSSIDQLNNSAKFCKNTLSANSGFSDILKKDVYLLMNNFIEFSRDNINDDLKKLTNYLKLQDIDKLESETLFIFKIIQTLTRSIVKKDWENSYSSLKYQQWLMDSIELIFIAILLIILGIVDYIITKRITALNYVSEKLIKR